MTRKKIKAEKLHKPLFAPRGDVKMLCFDIETRPALAYIWRMFDENISIGQLEEPTEMISWSAKWVGSPEVEFRSTFHDGQDIMVQRIWQLLDEADVVIHYNGKSFDVPHVNREFLRQDLLPPSPYAQIDLLKVCQRKFNFMSNKLAYVSEYLGLAGKVGHEGFGLWKKCLADDEEAWNKMREYNVQDTILLEELYEKLLPWISNHPSFGAFTGADVCPRCGGDHLQSRGFAHTRMGKFRRFQCQDCGSWLRSSKKESGTKITEVAS